MQKIGNNNNVLNDTKSQTKFENLNEGEFLVHFFDALKIEMKEKFHSYFFLCVFNS